MRPTWPPRASSMPAAAFATFFFQAEDGIRDTSVTGVQTCALPIFERYLHLHSVWTFFISRCFPICFLQALSSFDRICQLRRSEERRVGKECRPRLSAEELTEKARREQRSQRRREVRCVGFNTAGSE